MNILHKILDSLNKKNNNHSPELHLSATFPNYNQRNDCYKILIQQKETETLVSEANVKIDKINDLVLILNNTINRKEFYDTLEEISNIFTELLDYEYKLDFPYSTSTLLKDFENKKEKWIWRLEQRISEKEKCKTKTVSLTNKRDDILSKSKENSINPTWNRLNSNTRLPDLDNNNEIHENESTSPLYETDIHSKQFLEHNPNLEILVNSHETEPSHQYNDKLESLHYDINENFNHTIEYKSNLTESEPQNDTPEQNIKKYIFPSVELLIKQTQKELPSEELNAKALKLVETLLSFDIDAEIIDIFLGARFTRFEIQLGKGMRIKDVHRIKDNIQLSLETTNIHIEAPIPGRTTIGIDAENKELSIVSLRSILESNEFNQFPSNLTIAIGKDIAGNIIVDSIENMCHLLIGGTTGSGKSVFINSMLISILYKASPIEVKFLLIDTLGVNLSIYNHIPHLLLPVITDCIKASAALRWCVNEMKERYHHFAVFGVKDLQNYNKSIEKYSFNNTLAKLPRIVIVIDDFSDLMKVSNNIIEENICKLAQMGRACGIHLIISTQRPSVDVITGTIKANLPSRIAFKVFSAIDSKTVLDAKGAEDLLSEGDMLYYPQGARTPLRIQGTFISNKEVCDVLDFLNRQLQ